MRIPPQLFGFNDFNPSVKVRKINCGLGHMAAITNYGDLYIWGKNRERCLGLANEKDQYFPLKVHAVIWSFNLNYPCLIY